MPLQLWDKSDFVPQLTPATNTCSSFFAIRRNPRLDPNPRSPYSKLKSPMAAQNQDAQVNSPPVSFLWFKNCQESCSGGRTPCLVPRKITKSGWTISAKQHQMSVVWSRNTWTFRCFNWCITELVALVIFVLAILSPFSSAHLQV
jgi:hypothetical protein